MHSFQFIYLFYSNMAEQAVPMPQCWETSRHCCRSHAHQSQVQQSETKNLELPALPSSLLTELRKLKGNSALPDRNPTPTLADSESISSFCSLASFIY